MIDLDKYRNDSGRININLAEDDGVIDIERNPQQSILGARTKYWCSNPTGDFLYKRTLLNNHEDFGEVLGYEFALLINLPCADYDFAVFNGENGVITSDIVGDDEELIGGNEILDYVNMKHIRPIQKICYKYYQLKQNKNNQKEYFEDLIILYDNSMIKSNKIDLLKNKYNNSDFNYDDGIKCLEEYFEELSILYPYNYGGYSTNMIDEEKKYNDYFIQNGYSINGWNRKRQVVVSNNLMDIWSLIDVYCQRKGYQYEDNHNIMLSLIRMLVYDMILNQGDRHISNWSIILNKKTKKIRFAPIYDNSKICNLDNSKEEIMQKAQAIKRFEENAMRMNPIKRNRSIINIERNLRGNIDSKLMIDYDDNVEENNKFTMLEKLIDMSDSNIYDIIRDICDKFNYINITNIFTKIEHNSHIKIPDEVKIVVLKTIELNINKINGIMEKYQERKMR